jgi:hypothetical protein
MSRPPLFGDSITPTMASTAEGFSTQDVRKFLRKNLEQVFGVRDARSCPIAQFYSEVFGLPMQYNTPADDVESVVNISWAPTLALAVDKEPTETVTAKRVLEIMDELGFVETIPDPKK